MEEWILKNKYADTGLLAKELGLSETVCRVLVNRDIKTVEEAKSYLNPDKGVLHAAALLKNAGEAAERLRMAVRERKKIRIIGDYDVDGIMSAYLLYETLQRLGAVVDYRIPDRVLDGYGMNESMVEEARREQIKLLLTCDNGIAAIEPVARAKEYGMEVIVTDHHDIPLQKEGEQMVPKLVAADVVVNPKQPGDTYPQPGICGAMVAYKVICLLLDLAGEEEPEKREEIELWKEDMLVYVAMATVCDVMELVGENRVAVAKGLAMLPHCRNIGMLSLLGVYDLTEKKISAYHAGFLLGPCFNAAGRLETALLGLELLLCRNADEAADRAAALKELNDTRKQMTVTATNKAIEIAENRLNREEKQVLVIYLPDCHESLAGIVAGRIRERFYRPTIVLTKGEHCIKGSGRSIPGYSMFEKLSEQKELFLAFGGHPMAAGLSLAEENIEELDKRLNAAAGLSEDDLRQKLYLDAVLSFDEISDRLMEELEYLEPFGNGNAKPLFASSGVEVERLSRLGREGTVLKLSLKDKGGCRAEGMLFSEEADRLEQYLTEQFGVETVKDLYRGTRSVFLTLSFSPRVNEYNGRKTSQVMIQKYKVTK